MRTFSIKIPVPAYISKFLHTRYQTPLKINNQTIVGIFILSTIQKKNAYTKLNEFDREKKLRTFNDDFQCIFPITDLYHIGTTITNDKIILINRFLEEHFDECFYSFVAANVDKTKRYAGIDTAIENFCLIHSIVIDEDITLDCLKKREYRHRQKISNKLLAVLSSRKNTLQNGQQQLFLV
jgi:hypothetical protein